MKHSIDRRWFLGQSALLVPAHAWAYPAPEEASPTIDLSRAGLARLEAWLQGHETDPHLEVHVHGRIAPIENWDRRYQPLIELFERYGVDEVIEHSDRGPFETAPIRVGQIDPAGIVYRAD